MSIFPQQQKSSMLGKMKKLKWKKKETPIFSHQRSQGSRIPPAPQWTPGQGLLIKQVSQVRWQFAFGTLILLSSSHKLQLQAPSTRIRTRIWMDMWASQKAISLSMVDEGPTRVMENVHGSEGEATERGSWWLVLFYLSPKIQTTSSPSKSALGLSICLYWMNFLPWPPLGLNTLWRNLIIPGQPPSVVPHFPQTKWVWHRQHATTGVRGAWGELWLVPAVQCPHVSDMPIFF